MCQNTPLTLLSTCRDGYVGRCEGCGHYNVAYKTSLLLFSEDELLGFHNILENRLGMWRMEEPLVHGRTLVMATPVPNLFLTFTVKEFSQLSDLVTEAVLLVETQRILRQAA